MSNIGCFVYMAGVLLCGPDHKVVHTYVAGEPPAPVVARTGPEKHAMIKRHLSKLHRNLWKMTDDELDLVMTAKYGPRRHLSIDWSKVKGYQP